MNDLKIFKEDLNKYLKLSAGFRKTTGKNGFKLLKRNHPNTSIEDLYNKLEKDVEHCGRILNNLRGLKQDYKCITSNKNVVKNSRLISLLRKIFSWTYSKIEDEASDMGSAYNFNTELLKKIKYRFDEIATLKREKILLKEKIGDSNKKLVEAKKIQTFLQHRVLKHPRLPSLKKDLLTSKKESQELTLKISALEHEREVALAVVDLSVKKRNQLQQSYEKKIGAVKAQLKAEEKNQKFLEEEINKIDLNLSKEVKGNNDLIKFLENTLKKDSERYKLVKQKLINLRSITIDKLKL